MDNVTYYHIGPADRIRFTDEGLRVLAPLFARAGINVRSIKTRAEYVRAHETARPYMPDYLDSLAQGNGTDSNTADRQLLIAAVHGDSDELKRLRARKLARNRLKLIK